jgi:hypothetical protein
VNRTSAVKNCHSSVMNPSWRASGGTVNATPTATTAKAASVKHETGPAAEDGTRRLRIAKMISVWVASDSTN